MQTRLRRRDDGFTLIELLVVVIIIGILAGIAIPVYLNQRRKATDAATRSNLRNASTFQISYMSEHGFFADPVDVLESDGWKHDPEVVFSAVVSSGAEWFCLEAYHQSAGGRVWTFDTVTSEFFVHTSTGNCPIGSP